MVLLNDLDRLRAMTNTQNFPATAPADEHGQGSGTTPDLT